MPNGACKEFPKHIQEPHLQLTDRYWGKGRGRAPSFSLELVLPFPSKLDSIPTCWLRRSGTEDRPATHRDTTKHLCGVIWGFLEINVSICARFKFDYMLLETKSHHQLMKLYESIRCNNRSANYSCHLDRVFIINNTEPLRAAKWIVDYNVVCPSLKPC